MAEHKCNKEIEIAELSVVVRKIDKLLTDNGHDGLPDIGAYEYEE